jgi:DNA-binding response OmpR family regulator
MRILVVEDDPKITAFIKIGLEAHGYLVENAYDGIEGERLVFSNQYDVIILDVLMPGITGTELCKKIRRKNISTSVIMMTSLDSKNDKDLGLECGADYYILKPFSFQELLARVKIAHNI